MGNIFQSDDVAFRVGIDNLFCHIPFVVVGVGDVDGHIELAQFQIAAYGSETLQGKIIQYLVGANAIFC